MMEQLGIEKLRPGASGDENSPQHANEDELLANPYPDLPDPLKLDNGQPVADASMWWHQRRPQIVAAFEQDVYGRIPRRVGTVSWRIAARGRATLGGYPIVYRQLVGQVDDSAYPLIPVSIPVTLVLPANAGRRVPVLIMLGFGPSPVPATEPDARSLDVLNHELRRVLTRQDPGLKAVFAAHPDAPLLGRSPFSPLRRNVDGGPPSVVELIAAGWGFAWLQPTTVQADSGAGLTRGIIGLTNRGRPRTPDQWGALRAWGWAASRTLDYLRSDPAVDGRHVGIEGLSRFGKAALVAMAFDPRFAMALIGSSGKGGATLLRRNFGETLGNLAGSGEYHWFAGNFLQYDAARAVFGSRNASDLPVDANELIALCAPRLVFVSYGIPSMGDAGWLDQRGSFMAAVSASRVYRLLGARGLGVQGSWRSAVMPPVNHGLLGGELAWRQDDGGHSDAPNMKYFIAWVDRHIDYHNPQRRGAAQ